METNTDVNGKLGTDADKSVNTDKKISERADINKENCINSKQLVWLDGQRFRGCDCRYVG